ncbi:beta-D-xylosidase 4 [Striga asiatica]|uniref:Beta-D-xylosidase 4 n=1 Tax=Striga asiatica TaxID=4170 RepID=A0A5A7Q8T8_STRAF|nr:beta-D-xylosidase 4 [Striga asiatica]
MEVNDRNKRAEKEEIESDKKKIHKKEDGDDDDDVLFYEGDSDSDSDDEFAFPGWIVEEDFWDRAAPMIDGVQSTDGDDRNCDKVGLCHNHKHAASFKGLRIFELFKVRLKLNEKIRSAPLINSRIYGEIATWPQEFELENPDPICYYRVSHLQAHTINLNPKEVVLLPLTSPEPRPPLYEDQVIYLAFALKIDDEDIFVHGQIDNSNNLFPGEGICRSDALVVRPHNSKALRKYGGPIIRRSLVGDPECDPVLMDAYYSMYDGAWATVSVKMLLEGMSRFSGFIVARPCIFYSRIRLLTVKRADEEKKTVVIQRGDEGRVGIDGSIKLTRSMVAVPCYSSLVIGAVLYEADGGRCICRGKTFFPAKKTGEQTKLIVFDGVPTLEVSAKWSCSVDKKHYESFFKAMRELGIVGPFGRDGALINSVMDFSLLSSICKPRAKENEVDTIYRVAIARFALLFRDFVC